MGARRLPTGGLAALAVTLAALAVVVVAGTPAPRAHRTTVTRYLPGTTIVRYRDVIVWRDRPGAAARGRAPSADADVTPTPVRRSPTTHRATRPRRSTTTPTRPTGTTPTTTSTTTTTTVAAPGAPPTSLEGTFEGGATTASQQLGPVRTVTVSVPPGIPVKLTVTCGLAHRSATSMTSATVHVVSGGASCTAVFSVPSTTPQPAPWRLTVS
jgi:hypothetical protein